MVWIRCVASLVALGVLVPGLAAADVYTVTIRERFPRRALVEAEITPDGGTIAFHDNQDTGLLHGWSTFLISLEARDAAGRFLDLSYTPTGRWRVPLDTDAPIQIRYWMNLQHDRFPTDPGDDETAYAKPYGVMWTGRALFLAGRETTDIDVRFVVPDGWGVSTPWSADLERPTSFRVRDTRELLNSAFFAGTPRTSTVEIEGLEARFALGGEGIGAHETTFVSLVRRYLEGYRDLFGTSPRARLLVIAADHDYWSGGVLGRTISVVAGDPPSDANKGLWVHLFAHELLHLWTAELRLAEERPGNLEWFKEGFAEYFAYLYELRAGDLPEAAFLDLLADRYTKYLAARPGGSIAAAGADKFEHYDLVYSGGMMAALALDLTIRRETGNTRTLAEIMPHLYGAFRVGGASADPLTARGLAHAADQLYGLDLSDFVDRYIEGTGNLPLRELLRHAGVRLEVEGGEEEMIATISKVPDPSQAQRALWAGLTQPLP